jgi:hypothetical protein
MTRPLQAIGGHDLITDQVVIVQVIECGILAPGLHLNGVACLVCGKPSGGRPVNIVFMADMGEPAGKYGVLYSGAFLFHEDEMPDEVNTLVVLAHVRYGFSPTIRQH